MKVNEGDDLVQDDFSSLVIVEFALLTSDPLDLKPTKQFC